MSYSCRILEGMIRTADIPGAIKVKNIIADAGAYTFEPEQDGDGIFNVELDRTDWLRYDEEDYSPLAEVALPGSVIRFLGEDDNIWSLKFEDGKVNDVPGLMCWEPEVTCLHQKPTPDATLVLPSKDLAYLTDAFEENIITAVSNYAEGASGRQLDAGALEDLYLDADYRHSFEHLAEEMICEAYGFAIESDGTSF